MRCQLYYHLHITNLFSINRLGFPDPSCSQGFRPDCAELDQSIDLKAAVSLSINYSAKLSSGSMADKGSLFLDSGCKHC